MTLPRDDELHAPRALDPTWAETCWFAAQIPERKIGIWTYPLFRTNLGIMSCGVYVWGRATAASCGASPTTASTGTSRSPTVSGSATSSCRSACPTSRRAADRVPGAVHRRRRDLDRP